MINKNLKDNLNKLEKGKIELDGITLLKDIGGNEDGTN